MNGIDVSKHQGVIDWQKVAKAGVEFAIIRAGYGKTNVDKYFKRNIEGAIKAGLKVGVYWFIYALNESDAIKNAEMFHKTIEPYRNNITMKVIADWEYDSDDYSKKNGVTQTNATRTQIVKVFLDYLKAKGWEVANYANPDYIRSKFNDLSEYPLWLAWYGASASKVNEFSPWMWQHSSSGSVPGVNGKCDVNICFEDAVSYYPIPEFTLTDYLNKINVDSSFNNRKIIATRNGIADYKGTAEQNIKMLELLKAGKLVK